METNVCTHTYTQPKYTWRHSTKTIATNCQWKQIHATIKTTHTSVKRASAGDGYGGLCIYLLWLNSIYYERIQDTIHNTAVESRGKKKQQTSIDCVCEQ